MIIIGGVAVGIALLQVNSWNYIMITGFYSMDNKDNRIPSLPVKWH